MTEAIELRVPLEPGAQGVVDQYRAAALPPLEQGTAQQAREGYRATSLRAGFEPERDVRARDLTIGAGGNPLRTRIYEPEGEIGRASCRERVCQYVWISVVAVSLKKKN